MCLNRKSLLNGQDLHQERQGPILGQLFPKHAGGSLQRRDQAASHCTIGSPHLGGPGRVVAHPQLSVGPAAIRTAQGPRAPLGLAGEQGHSALASFLAPLVVLGEGLQEQHLDAQTDEQGDAQLRAHSGLLLRGHLLAAVGEEVWMEHPQCVGHGIVLVNGLHGGIHTSQRAHQAHPVPGRHTYARQTHPSPLCLCIIVDNDDQVGSGVLRLLQEGHVAKVQWVEIPRGNHHGLAHGGCETAPKRAAPTLACTNGK
mmetsp:Transcript_42896/g.121219  ORF Transcript_42896/g.121219 Transcript_42896/m.121219 type:complete len:256 (-) Transcript_42896:2-769(-)